MLHQGYWLFEFISISSVINKARGQYERSFLFSESDDNDLTYFLLAQVKVIQQAITSLHTFLERKAGEVGALQQRLEGMEGLNHRQLALLRHALNHSGFRAAVQRFVPRTHRLRLLGPCGSGLQAATDTGTSAVAMAQSSSRFRLAIRAEQVARNGESDFWMTPQTRASSTLSYSWVSLLRKLMIRGASSMRANKLLSTRDRLLSASPIVMNSLSTAAWIKRLLQ